MSEKEKQVEPSKEEKKTVEIDAQELLDLRAEIEQLKKEKPKKTVEKHGGKKQTPPLTLTPPASPPASATEHGHEEGKPHYIGAWQKYCPTCGDSNPDFKDETECEDCHIHLGAKEVAEKLKACPNCGGHRAKVIKK